MAIDDFARFKKTYITECYELLEDMERRLVALDDNPKADKEELNAIFRCAHSIKGGAGAFGFDQIASFTHILEALLDAVREDKVAFDRNVVDNLLASVDIVLQLVRAAENGTSVPEDLGSDLADELIRLSNNSISIPQKKQQIKKKNTGTQEFNIKFTPKEGIFSSGNEPYLILKELASLGEAKISLDSSKIGKLEEFQPDKCYLSWNIELATNKGIDAVKEVFEFVEDDCDLEITETSSSTEELEQEEEEKSPESKENNTAIKANSVSSIRVDIDKVDRLVNMVGELVITQAMLISQSKNLPIEEYPDLIRGIDELSQHTRELQEAVMAVRMQPVKSIFSRMPRLVRDLSKQLEKDIRLETHGENTEVDKTVIEQLSDPLTHMIRNSVDHGVETPADRKATGKPGQGVIHLSASHRGGRIIIEVSDDGKGINREKVLAKAKSKGIVAENAAPSDEEIDNMIFMPSFSTADQVSNISGRGVGMDVVKKNIEAMGGNVFIENNPGVGASFSISLPLTLAILDGMIVRSGVESYIIPIANIIETMRPGKTEVKKIADGNDIINVRGEIMPLVYLYKLFAIPDAIHDAHNAIIVLVENGKEKLGIVVDELVGQQQVVIKSIEQNFGQINCLSGATVLGDGKVSLILDVAGISAARTLVNCA